MSDTPSDPSHIERDLDQTRARLGSHLSELQDRLSPGQVLDDLMGYFRGSEGAAFGRSLLDNVRGNPMPAALTGIGLAWLMAAGPRAPAAPADAPQGSGGGGSGSRLSHYGRDDYTAALERIDTAEQGVTRHAEEAEAAYSSRLDTARGQAIGLARHAQETTNSFGERVRDALAAAKRAVTEKAQDLGDQVSGAARAAGSAIGVAQNAAQGAARSASGGLLQGTQAAGQASSNLVGALTESPVLLGALGLAAGALLGALLPQSDQEEAALGGIAGQARDAATSLAKEGLERGKHVAQTVVDKGRDSVQAQGLAGGRSSGEMVDAALSGELAGSAKQVLQDVLRTGDEAVRNEAVQASRQPASGPSEQPPTQRP